MGPPYMGDGGLIARSSIMEGVIVPMASAAPLPGCSGDLVSRPSNGPYGASSGISWGLIGDTKWTY